MPDRKPEDGFDFRKCIQCDNIFLYGDYCPKCKSKKILGIKLGGNEGKVMEKVTPLPIGTKKILMIGQSVTDSKTG